MTRIQWVDQSLALSKELDVILALPAPEQKTALQAHSAKMTAHMTKRPTAHK